MTIRFDRATGDEPDHMKMVGRRFGHEVRFDRKLIDGIEGGSAVEIDEEGIDARDAIRPADTGAIRWRIIVTTR